MPVTMKIDTVAFLSAVFPKAGGLKIAELACYDYVYGMYTVTVKEPSSGAALTIGTGKSTMAIAAGKVDPININILAKNLLAAFSKLGQPMTKFKDGDKTSVFELMDKMESEKAPKKPADVTTEELKAAIESILGEGKGGMTPEQAKATGVLDKVEEFHGKIAAEKASGFMGITTAKLTLPKVELIDATAVGQKVEGTSASSTYYAVALASNFKVAARLSGSKVSVRVEGSPNPAEQQQLMAMGLSKSPSGHWSTHFGIETVPVERVLGAVLMSIGAKYIRKVESAAEVAEALK